MYYKEAMMVFLCLLVNKFAEQYFIVDYFFEEGLYALILVITSTITPEVDFGSLLATKLFFFHVQCQRQ